MFARLGANEAKAKRTNAKAAKDAVAIKNMLPWEAMSQAVACATYHAVTLDFVFCRCWRIVFGLHRAMR